MKKFVTTLSLFVFSIGLFAQFDGVNLALNKPATVSSAIQPASNAVDGNYTTRWGSLFANPQSMSFS
jgi:hypothetical protein